jgi:hypothetical protein
MQFNRFYRFKPCTKTLWANIILDNGKTTFPNFFEILFQLLHELSFYFVSSFSCYFSNTGKSVYKKVQKKILFLLIFSVPIQLPLYLTIIVFFRQIIKVETHLFFFSKINKKKPFFSKKILLLNPFGQRIYTDGIPAKTLFSFALLYI